jgi:glycosyltransferase involved in cell wall biosynthesis
MVLAQALAAGLPVLATPNSSAPDIVRHGETG